MVPPITPLSIAEPLSWVIVLGFLLAAVLEYRGDARARPIAVGTWFLFAVFWLVLIPHFVLDQKSIVESVGGILAVPLSVYAGVLLHRGRDSLFLMTRAVGIMGLIYLPFSYLPFFRNNPARRWLVEGVADQSHFLLELVGTAPTHMVGGMKWQGHDITKPFPYHNTYVYEAVDVSYQAEPVNVMYSIVIACTGIGAMAIFAGAILAVRAPMDRKLKALAVSIPVIYGANLFRNVFISTMYGQQRMHWFPDVITTLFGAEAPKVSYYVSDRLLAQFGSVVALIVITLLVVRVLPEIVVLVEDVLRLLTGREWDLADAIGVEVPESARLAGGED